MSVTLMGEVETLLSGVSNLFIGAMADTPDNAVCLLLTGGFERSMSGTYLEEPTFQVLVRNTDYVTGVALCDSIKDKLHGKDTTAILSIQQMGDTQQLGQDDRKRWRFTINFKCYFRR